MADYLIHACEQRLWYVEDLLIPSMVKQGIDKSNIDVYVDKEKLGNLEAFVQSLYLMDYSENKGKWHLQDDVVISKQFRRWTEEYDDGTVCAFCNCYSEKFPMGVVEPRQMWFSFQCMRIPDVIAKEFATWFYHETQYNQSYANWVRQYHDDYIFHLYMESHFKDERVLNLAPNVVDHIDYLINGSVINQNRGDLDVRSIYFHEDDTIQELMEQLSEREKEKEDAST